MKRNGTRWLGRALGVAVVGLGLGACSDSTGPAGTGHMSVTLQGAGGSSSIFASVAPQYDEHTSENVVPLEAVASVEITVNRVDALPSGESEEGEGGWVSLVVDPEVVVDLTDLGATPLTLAQGDVPAGSYSNLRLFFSEASVTLDEPYEHSSGQVVEPGTHDLFIPSGMQTGVKIPLFGFEIEEGGSGTVELELDSEASIQTLVYAPGRGFIMSPVLTQAGSEPEPTEE